MNSSSVALQNALQFFSDNPSVFSAQIVLVILAFIVIFLVLLATRDIMMRSDSLLVQVLSIILVAGLPILGYFLYVLVRPSRTLSEKRLQSNMEILMKKFSQTQQMKKVHAPEKGKKSA